MLCPDAIKVTPFSLAQRFIGLQEFAGAADNPAIVAMLQRCNKAVTDDETPWCSAFANYIMELLGQPRTRSLRARSWLTIGQDIKVADAEPGFDIAVFARGEDDAGPEVINAPGHVGFFAGLQGREYVQSLGGNQGDGVCVRPYPLTRLLGIRRVFG